MGRWLVILILCLPACGMKYSGADIEMSTALEHDNGQASTDTLNKTTYTGLVRLRFDVPKEKK